MHGQTTLKRIYILYTPKSDVVSFVKLKWRTPPSSSIVLSHKGSRYITTAWINECSPRTPRLMSIVHEMPLPLSHINIYILQMSHLSFPRTRQMLRYVPTDAGFLCYKLEAHRRMINGTPLYRHTPRIGTYMLDSLHSCLVNSAKTANKTALNWYVSKHSQLHCW